MKVYYGIREVPGCPVEAYAGYHLIPEMPPTNLFPHPCVTIREVPRKAAFTFSKKALQRFGKEIAIAVPLFGLQVLSYGWEEEKSRTPAQGFDFKPLHEITNNEIEQLSEFLLQLERSSDTIIRKALNLLRSEGRTAYRVTHPEREAICA